MKKYLLRLPDFGLEMSFRYDENEYLVSYQLEEGEPEQKVFYYLSRHWPTTYDKLKDLEKSAKNAKVTAITEEVTFEQFWEKYGYKVDKKVAEKRWNNLPKKDRAQAYDFIDRYKSQVNIQGIAMKHPKTYLSQEPWKV